MTLKKAQTQKYFRALWWLLGIWILWQVGTVTARSASLPRQVRKVLVQYQESEATAAQTRSEERRSRQAQNYQKSLFAPAPAKPSIPQCMAVLGEEALINSRWYKVGDEVDGAKILEVMPYAVKVLWEEQERTLIPFNERVEYANSGQSSNRGGQSGQSNARGSGMSGRGNRSFTAPGGGGFGGGPGGGFNMSSEERRQMFEQYRNASPEERDQMRQQMRDRFMSGGGGGGGRSGNSGDSGGGRTGGGRGGRGGGM